MGGHDHHEKMVIPDYRIYKVEDCPELMEVKKKLAQKGLKDPWLRNEVWRYNEKEFQTHAIRLRSLMFRGFKYGFAAFCVTTILETAYDHFNPEPEHGHGHH